MEAHRVARGVGKLFLAIIAVAIFLFLFGTLPPVEAWQFGPTLIISLALLAVALATIYFRAKRSATHSKATTSTMARKLGKGALIVLLIVAAINVLHFLARA